MLWDLSEVQLPLAFNGRSLIVARASRTARRKMVRSSIDEIHHEVGNTMKRLAD